VFEYTGSVSSEVFIFGAGFSRALSAEMPLTDELGSQVAARLGLDLRFEGGHFEVWLSRRAEAQPDLTHAENLANRAQFAKASGVVASLLAEAEEEALGEALAQPWLAPLLAILHLRMANVITFNQDTLVERAVDQAGLHSWGPQPWEAGSKEWGGITSNDVLRGVPRLPGNRLEDDGVRPTFAFLKLHGSTNWYWREGDESGATLYRWFLPGKSPSPIPTPEAERLRFLPGLIPLVVPPIATKSPYYRTPLTSHLWQRARHALRDTSHVTFIGYSLPVTDLVVTGMLRETIGRESTNSPEITVVDPASESVTVELGRLGIPADLITEVHSISEFVETAVTSSAEGLVTAMLNHLDQGLELGDRLLVGCAYNAFQNVVRINASESGDELELHLETLGAGGVATNVLAAGAPTPVTGRQLAEQVSAQVPTRIVGVSQDGHRASVIAASPWNTPGQEAIWQALITAP
jgi:hypothetical protein